MKADAVVLPPHFLEAGLKLNPRVEVKSPHLVKLAEELVLTSFANPKKRAHKLTTARVLLGNLFHVWEQQSSLRVPLRKSRYARKRRLGQYHLSRDAVKKLLTAMEDQGLINIKRGFYFGTKKTRRNRETRIWVTEALAQQFSQLMINGELIEVKPPAASIVVKDSEKNILSKLQTSSLLGSDVVRERELLICRYNQLIEKALLEVSLDEKNVEQIIRKYLNSKFRLRVNRRHKTPSATITGPKSKGGEQGSTTEQQKAHLKELSNSERRAISRKKIISSIRLLRFQAANKPYCVFNNSTFTNGGRLYGPPYQSLPKMLRKHILIDGQKTVELDYSAIHVNICYRKKGIVCPKIPYLVETPRPLRRICKLLLNIAFNANNRREALKAALQEIRLSWDLYGTLVNSPYGGIKPINRLELIYQELLKQHVLIDDCIASEMGPALQYEDSVLAVEVVKYFTDRGILVLPIHDSFIIQEEYQTELLDVMKSVYRRRYGGEIEVSGFFEGAVYGS